MCRPAASAVLLRHEVAGRLRIWPRDLLLAALRIALAIPVGYAFSALAAEAIALPIAFMMGAFPIKTNGSSNWNLMFGG